MTRRKSYLSRYSILDILADFIMRPVQKVERSKPHPVKNADAEWYDAKRRRRREVSYDSLIDGGAQVDFLKKFYFPDEKTPD